MSGPQSGIRDAWNAVGAIAKYIPTPHNTQPFRLRPLSARRAQLILLTDRLLPQEDRGNRYVFSCCGGFAEVVKAAGRARGLRIKVRLVKDMNPAQYPDGSLEVIFGHAEIRGRCRSVPAQAVTELRRTSRLAYSDSLVVPRMLARLRTSVRPYGHRLLVTDEAAVVRRVLDLNVNAILDNLRFTTERREIATWTRLGRTPRHGDGLWRGPMNQPAWELWSALRFPWVFRIPAFRRFASRRFLATQRGTRYIGLLCGPFASWPELVAAGRALFRFWHTMAEGGIYMQPFGSMLTNRAYARQVARMFGLGNCWLIFRFGHSAVPPRAPRLASIVVR